MCSANRFVLDAAPQRGGNAPSISSLHGMRYRADITAGSLKVKESRVIADLLLRGVPPQGKKGGAVQRQCPAGPQPDDRAAAELLLRKRLATMDADLWKLVRDGSVKWPLTPAWPRRQAQPPLGRLPRSRGPGAVPALQRERSRITLWDDYIEDCRGRDPDMPMERVARSPGSGPRSSRSSPRPATSRAPGPCKLQTVHIAKQVLHYLEEHDEEYVLRCIQVGP